MAQRILLADTDPTTRERIRSAAQRIDAEFRLTDDVQEAITQARRFRPDLLVANVALGSLSGDEGRRHLRQLKDAPAARLLLFASDAVSPKFAESLASELEAPILCPEHGEVDWEESIARALATPIPATEHPGPPRTEAAPIAEFQQHGGIPQLNPSALRIDPGGPSREILEKVTRKALEELADRVCDQVIERVEQIAWELVPEITETLVREELRKLRDTPAEPGSKGNTIPYVS